MDHRSLIEKEVRVDIECVVTNVLNDNENESQTVFTNLCDHVMSVDDHLVKSSVVEQENSNIGKDIRKKSLSAKKPPRPPGPHRGYSLDAVDQKLIKELAELAMIKRARIERMKTLMQKKTTKTSSSSTSSSNGSLFAMLFTIVFFIVILFQGMSCQISCGTFDNSPQSTQTNENALIFIQEELNPSAHDSV